MKLRLEFMPFLLAGDLSYMVNLEIALFWCKSMQTLQFIITLQIF